MCERIIRCLIILTLVRVNAGRVFLWCGGEDMGRENTSTRDGGYSGGKGRE